VVYIHHRNLKICMIITRTLPKIKQEFTENDYGRFCLYGAYWMTRKSDEATDCKNNYMYRPKGMGSYQYEHLSCPSKVCTGRVKIRVALWYIYIIEI
jgi:hypothetical protein